MEKEQQTSKDTQTILKISSTVKEKMIEDLEVLYWAEVAP